MRVEDNPIKAAVKFATRVYDVGLEARVGESLRDHNLATAVIEITVLPKSFIRHLANVTGESSEAIKAVLMLSGLLHDWGKALLPYQEHLRLGGTHPPLRHEVTSFIVFTSMLKPSRESAKTLYIASAGAILYHHHGLYDFTDKITKYLRGGVRAWPTLSDSNVRENLLSKLRALKEALLHYLRITGLNEVIEIRLDSIIDSLVDEEGFRRLLGETIKLEEEVNESRNLVTPVLSALMVGDNLSAASSLFEGNERVQEAERISLMSKATIASVLPHYRMLKDSLNTAGLSNYANAIRELMFRYSGGRYD